MDICVSSLFTIYMFVESATGYRWTYGMNTKDDAIKVLRRWCSDIADLRIKHKMVVFNAIHARQCL